MAQQTKSVSGNVTTYTITDAAGSSVAVAVTVNPVTGNTVTYTSSGGLHGDGQQMLAQLTLLTATGLLP